MKHLFTFLFLLSFLFTAISQSEVELLPEGIVVPRIEPGAVVAPVMGQLIYSPATTAFWFYDGAIWQLVGSTSDKIVDADADTKVELIENAIGDEIHFSIDGTVRAKMLRDSTGRSRIELINDLSNTFIGVNAGELNTTGNANTYLGYNSGKSNKIGVANTFIGSNTGFSNTVGFGNVFLGSSSFIQNTTGILNVAIGASSGFFNITGDSNVFLGYQAGFNELGSNRLYIENSSADSTGALIFGQFDNDFLRINGTLNISGNFEFPTIDGIDGQVLKTNGGGVLSWQNDDDDWLNFGNDIYFDTGNVGIGVSSPSSALDVSGNVKVTTTGSTQVEGIIVEGAATTNRVKLDLRNNDTKGHDFSLNSTGGGAGAGEGRFLIKDETNNVNRLVIDSTGNVGINTNDPKFKMDIDGFSASNNQISIIPLWQAGSNFSMNNTSGSDLANCESAIIPALYESNGDIEVRLVIRISSTSAGTNNFQLRSHDGTTETFAIVNSDTWTFSSTQTGQVAVSQWKDWAGGTKAHEIHLYGWVDA